MHTLLPAACTPLLRAGASLDVVLSMPDPTRLYAAAATAAAASPPPMPLAASGLTPPPPPAAALGNTSNIDNGSGDAAAFLSRVVEALTSDLQLAIALGVGVPLEQVQVVPGTLQMRLPPSPPPSPPLPPPLPPLPSPSALPVVVVRDPNTVGTFESSRQWSIPIIISLSVAAGLVGAIGGPHRAEGCGARPEEGQSVRQAWRAVPFRKTRAHGRDMAGQRGSAGAARG